MLARTDLVVEPGGVLGKASCQPPLTVRQVHAEDTGTCALALVGTAAGPLAGDDLSLSLRLKPGARAVIRATGASMAQGRNAGPARLSVCADAADGASLTADLGALIVCHGGRVDVTVCLSLGKSATLDWRELVVLGRTAEPPGAATIRWDVTRSGRPVLRQLVDLTDPALLAWPGHVARRRVLACALLADPAAAFRAVIASPTAIAQPLPDGAVLATVLAHDAATAAVQLDGLCAAVREDAS